MRDHVERLVMFPFSMGCDSEASVGVGKNEPKKQKHVPEDHLSITKRFETKESRSKPLIRSMRIFLSPKPKSSTFQGLQRFIKRLRTFPQLFVYKEEMDEIETEMEIGLPTDVKHVTHIGWDGSTTINPIKGWDNLKAPEVMSFPSISLRQFELAMAAQAAPIAPAPLVKDTIIA